MFKSELLATSAKRNNPLLGFDLDYNRAEWQSGNGRFDKITEMVTHPSDGTKHAMSSVTTWVGGINFSKSEEFVRYSDTKVQKESVYWDTELQIYYWQSKTDNAWYFEDPCNEDAITKAGTYNKLLRQLESRLFSWLEADEDVSVTRNADGSKCYDYKGLHDPAQITALLEEEAKQERIASEKPVSQWKAVALSAMTLMGYSTGFQRLAKSYVSVAEPSQSESVTPDTSIDAVQLPCGNASLEPKQSVDTGSTDYFGYYPFSILEYQPRAIVKTVQFFSTMATGFASMIHPRLGREHSVLGSSSLLTLLSTVPSTDGYIVAEANEKSLSTRPKADLSEPETFTHVFDIPALPDDLSLPMLKPVMYPNQGIQRWSPQWTTVVDNAAVTSHISDSGIATSLMSANLPSIPVAHSSEQVESRQEVKPTQKTISLLDRRPAFLPLFKQPPQTNVQNRQLFAPTSLFAMGFNSLLDVIQIADRAFSQLEQYIRAVQEKVIVNDEKSAKEKTYAVQLLSDLGFALSRTSELLGKLEKSSEDMINTAISYQIKILEGALSDVRAYFPTQVLDSSLMDVSGLKKTPTSDTSFLSTVSAAIADVDSKTLAIVLGIVGGVIAAAVGVGAYMKWRKLSQNGSKVMPGYEPQIDETLKNEISYKELSVFVDEDRLIPVFASFVQKKTPTQPLLGIAENSLRSFISSHQVEIKKRIRKLLLVDMPLSFSSSALSRTLKASSSEPTDAVADEVSKIKNELMALSESETTVLKLLLDSALSLLNSISKLQSKEKKETAEYESFLNKYKDSFSELEDRIYEEFILESCNCENIVHTTFSGSTSDPLSAVLSKKIFTASKPLLQFARRYIQMMPPKTQKDLRETWKIKRMYVPEGYMGFYYHDAFSKQDIEYLATSGVTSCIAFMVFCENDQGQTLTILSHLDGGHNSRDKLKSYFSEMLSLINAKMKNPSITPIITVNRNNHVSERIQHPILESEPNYTEEFSALEDEIFIALKDLGLNPTAIVVAKSQSVGNDIWISTSNGHFSEYSSSMEQGTLTNIPEDVSFGEHFNMGDDNAELYYLKTRGGMCQVDKTFLVKKADQVYYQADFLKKYPQQVQSGPKLLCLGRDQMPSTREDLKKEEGQFGKHDQDEPAKVFKFGFK